MRMYSRQHSIVLAIKVCAVVCSLTIPVWAQPGDMNCDGIVGLTDVPLLVNALLGVGGPVGCDVNRADMNGDGAINGRDIQLFVRSIQPNPCFGGQQWCNGMCVEVELDPSNCGSCGHQCGPGEYCAGGICQTIDP